MRKSNDDEDHYYYYPEYKNPDDCKEDNFTDGEFDDEYNNGYAIHTLKFIAFYGSVKSFKYFLLNDAEISSNLNKYAIAGGNLEIIHIVEQRGIKFDNCLTTSIIFHHNSIANWLMDNYECETIKFETALEAYNFQVFLFLYYNCCDPSREIPIDKTYYLQTHILSDSYILPIIDFLINDGVFLDAKINSEQSTYFELFKKDKLDSNLIKCLVEKVPDTLDWFGLVCMHDQFPQIDHHRFTALIDNESSPDFDLINFFISHGADVNKKYNLGPYNKFKSDIILPNLESKELIKLFIENGADVNLQSSNENSTLSAEFLDRSTFDQEYVEYLIQHGGDINALMQDNLSLLYKLLSPSNRCSSRYYTDNSKAQAEKFNFLISKGVNCNNGRLSPIFALCSKYTIDYDMIEILLKNGADINYGELNPLYALCHHSSVKLEDIKYFLEKGAKISSCNKNLIQTLIESGNRDYELYKYLIDNGCKEAASKSRILPLCKDNNDNSELIHLLVDNGALADYFITLDSEGSCLYHLCNKPDLDFPLIQYLVEKKALHNFDAKDKYNNTPLLLVCKNENVSIPLIQCLIDNGADINAINKTGQTPLSILCGNENIQIPIIQYLVDKGANVNLGKNPPINILCKKETLDYDFIKYFIEKGANVNLGEEPILYHLCQQKTLDCDLIKILVENGGNVNYSFKKRIHDYYNKIRIKNFESKEIQSTIFKEISQ